MQGGPLHAPTAKDLETSYFYDCKWGYNSINGVTYRHPELVFRAITVYVRLLNYEIQLDTCFSVSRIQGLSFHFLDRK